MQIRIWLFTLMRIRILIFNWCGSNFSSWCRSGYWSDFSLDADADPGFFLCWSESGQFFRFFQFIAGVEKFVHLILDVKYLLYLAGRGDGAYDADGANGTDDTRDFDDDVTLHVLLHKAEECQSNPREVGPSGLSHFFSSILIFFDI